MDFPLLGTERLSLIQMDKRHSGGFFDIMSRDQVTKYYGMNSLSTIQEAERIMESFQETFNSKRGIRWGIILKDSGRFIGTIGLNNLNIYGKKAEIGYELHPDYWRQGYAKEAVTEVLRYAFQELGLYRMGANTFPQNDASNQLLSSFGFQKEGVLRGYLYQNNRSHDAIVYSLLKPEWRKRFST